ncbi:DnaJ-domain-containing protein [Pyrenochaeta sp. DS3sAY3a]|nr:DnaJ-domain-containing protein [Pyrenochaeta sp. DS3sAY3a]
MPPRPSLLLRHLAPPIARPRLTCRVCVRQCPPPPRRLQSAPFHTTPPRLSDNIPNHYETLQLTSSATPADIKRQFYALSKKHHPDRNQDDPNASTRFVAISEAYHVLSVPERRAQYDAQFHRTQPRSRWAGGSDVAQGSYSSSSFGSRPASGLNKKRTTFRGPPPSFYKSGGYGRHGAKRQEYAYHNPHETGEAGTQAAGESYGDFGGFGPGQQKQGNQVPHFNDRRHKKMHDNVNEHIHSRRRHSARMAQAEADLQRRGMLTNFIVVTGMVGLIGITAKMLGDRDEKKRFG